MFPQSGGTYTVPELVLIEAPVGGISAGPTDCVFSVVNPRFKRLAFSAKNYLPPYVGSVFEPATCNRTGDFDHYQSDSPQFRAAHVYAICRLTLDLWQRYLGQPIILWCNDVYSRLEIVPLVEWDNAHFGPGFLEYGKLVDLRGLANELWMDLDAVAHELGHVILCSVLSYSKTYIAPRDFLAFHEVFADFVSVTSALTFQSVRERVLLQTRGELRIQNLASRICEFSDGTCIRTVCNDSTMSDVDDITLQADGAWVDRFGEERTVFDYAAPLSGALYDILVTVYEAEMAERQRGPVHALSVASDALGSCIAYVARTMRADTLTFSLISDAFLEGASNLGLGRLMPSLALCFLNRGINPFVSSITAGRHLGSRDAVMKFDRGLRTE